MSHRLPLDVGDVKRDDLAFVISSWAESSHNGPVGRLHRRGLWCEQQSEVARHIIGRSHLLVAHHENDREQLYGWICFAHLKPETWAIHYIYVKQPFRKLGIARALLLASGWRPGHDIVATHATYLTQKEPLMRRYRVEHNLFLAHESEDDAAQEY